LRRAIDVDSIGAEIDRYDPVDAAAVCDSIRISADVDLLADQFIDLYDELCAQPVSYDDEMLTVSRSLSRMASHLYAQGGANDATKFNLLRKILLRFRSKRVKR